MASLSSSFSSLTSPPVISSTPSSSAASDQPPATLDGLSLRERYALLLKGKLRFAALDKPAPDRPAAWKGLLAGGAIGDLGECEAADLFDQRIAVLRNLRDTLAAQWGSLRAVSDALRCGPGATCRKAVNLLSLVAEPTEKASPLGQAPIDQLEDHLAALARVVRHWEEGSWLVLSKVDKGEVPSDMRLLCADARAFGYALRQHRLADMPSASRTAIVTSFHLALEKFLDGQPKGATPLEVAGLLHLAIERSKAGSPAAGEPAESKSKAQSMVS